MFRILTITYFDVLAALGVAAALTTLGLILFKCVWIRRVAFYFPAGGFKGEVEDSFASRRIVTHTMGQYFACLFRRLFPLRASYWVPEAGFDGILKSNSAYCFLRFQFMILRIMIIYSVINGIIFFAMWLYIFIKQAKYR